MMTEDNGRSGIVSMARAVIAAPFERLQLQEARARNERLSLEAANAMLEQTVRYVTPDDDRFTELLGGPSDRKLDEVSTTGLREAALRAAYRSPLMIGYLRTLKRFVLGTGPQFDPGVDDERLAGRMMQWWDLFRLLNDWDEIEDEIPWRTWRDGETFTRFFEHDVDGPRPVELDQQVAQRLANLQISEVDLEGGSIPRGMTFLRILDPAQITDPQGVVKNGIVTHKDDVRTVYGYLWAPDPANRHAAVEFIHADEMMHIKIGVDSDVPRGRSILEPLLERDRQYNDWLQYRLALSLARAAVVLIKKIEGTPEQVSAIRDARVKQRDDSPNDRKTQMLKPMTTVHAGPGISYEFKSPNLQAQDAQHDGRSIMLTMAAAAGLPEYIFSGDSSNANYASTLVSEGPAYREFKSQRDDFTPRYQRIFRSVMVAGAAASAIEGLSAPQARQLDVGIEWPNIEVRDELDHAKANKIRHNGGILSREGWARDEGIDHDTERERINRERQEDIEFTGLPREE